MNCYEHTLIAKQDLPENQVTTLIKKYEDLITYVEDRPGHDLRYAISNYKISSLLKWKPRINFDNGIKKTILWYLNNEERWKNK